MKKTLILLLLIAGGACYAQKNSLLLNLKQDSTYFLTNNANMTVVEDIQGQQQVLTIAISGRMSHKVVAIRDTVYELAMAYENVSMLMELGGKTMMNINTSMNGQDPMNKMMATMLHRPITILINKKGKVIEIRHSDTIYAHMFDEFPQISAEKKAQFKTQMEKSFGDKALKSNFQDAFAVLPDRDVTVNDSWVFNSVMESIVKANVKTTYVLKDITANAYVVHGESTVGSSGNGEYAEVNGMPMRLNDASGTYTVDVKLDRQTGWVTEAKITKNIKGVMQIKDSEKVPGGMNIPITLNGDITMNNN